jgi:glutaredoxin
MEGIEGMRVRVFSTSSCAYCPAVKKYLDSKNIRYEVIDCTDDPRQLEPASEVSNMFTVPQTKIGHEVVVGLNYGKLADTLRRNGLME